MKLLVLLGDQLFSKSYINNLKPDYLFMSEDYGLCTRFQFHKQKIAFFLTAMRTYKNELSAYLMDYYHLEDAGNFFSNLKKTLIKRKIKVIHFFEIADSFMRNEMISFCEKEKIEFKEHASPMFVTSKEEFKKYLNKYKKPFMKTFYQYQRRRLDILINKDGSPVGNKWSFDEDNRYKIPSGHKVVSVPVVNSSQIFEIVKPIVNKKFLDHPGKVDTLWLPTDRKSCHKWFDQFLEQRFTNFGAYEDALCNQTPILYHSAISIFLNTGLLTPTEVIQKTLEYADKNHILINNTEGFIRQIIGWREFVRGIYTEYEKKMSTENFWKHTYKLKKTWYLGTTGIEPLDKCIKKVQEHGYLHHIERLMVVSNIMLLSGVHPNEVYRWFMEMFIDSGDWVMAANVYGMGQMSEGGIFATKPYICGSNYLLKMSNYKKGPWTEVLDGLYWSFVDRNKNFFSKNPRMSVMVRALERMDVQRKKNIFILAENFKEKNLSK